MDGFNGVFNSTIGVATLGSLSEMPVSASEKSGPAFCQLRVNPCQNWVSPASGESPILAPFPSLGRMGIGTQSPHVEHNPNQPSNPKSPDMKTPNLGRSEPFADRQAPGLGMVMKSMGLLILLLAARPASAATTTPYTASGWITGVPVPSILCTNNLGQVFFRGNAHTVRVEGSQPILTGRRLVFVDGGYQADGSAVVTGAAYQEVGTWNLADPANPKFTPTGGLWEMTYRGVMQLDNSLQLHLVGRGSGGAIDGLRMEEDVTRAAGDILDPAIPYLYTGVLKPAPVNTIEILDNFDDGTLSGTLFGKGMMSQANGQLTAVGAFNGVHTRSILDSYMFGGPQIAARTVPNGQTLEWRADLLSLDDNATNTAILAVGADNSLYALHKGREFAYVLKWTADNGISIFACDVTPIRNTNVILALAVTRTQPNVSITARVLDRDNPGTVLYERRVMDTPAADPSLTVSQFQALTGMRLTDLVSDVARAPIGLFLPLVGVFQYTGGSEPTPSAVYDNLEVRTSEIPHVGIANAVQLSWPTSSTLHYAAEGAPTVDGPWLPVSEPEAPGFTRMAIPADPLTQFFRLREAP